MDFKNERIEEAKLWMNRAKSNLYMAKLGFENKILPESVYNSQQVAEKTLKSVLVLFGEDRNEHKVTNYFDDLVNLKYDFDFDTIIENSFELERHWLSSRYPIKKRDNTMINPDELYNKIKTEKLLKKAEYVFKKVNEFLEKELDLKLI